MTITESINLQVLPLLICFSCVFIGFTIQIRFYLFLLHNYINKFGHFKRSELAPAYPVAGRTSLPEILCTKSWITLCKMLTLLFYE